MNTIPTTRTFAMFPTVTVSSSPSRTVIRTHEEAADCGSVPASAPGSRNGTFS